MSPVVVGLFSECLRVVYSLHWFVPFFFVWENGFFYARFYCLFTKWSLPLIPCLREWVLDVKMGLNSKRYRNGIFFCDKKWKVYPFIKNYYGFYTLLYPFLWMCLIIFPFTMLEIQV